MYEYLTMRSHSKTKPTALSVTSNVFQHAVIQTKLVVNKPGDEYEREADTVADQVISTPMNDSVSRTPPHIQRFTGQVTWDTYMASANVDRVIASPGRPLEPALRHDMEQRFGYDFSQVRVHSDATALQSAQEMNAQAYTVGQDIVFGAGRFAPGTYEGRHLIAHELTHVVQQSGSRKLLQRAETDTVPGCAPLADSQADVDARVNRSLAAGRRGAGNPPSGRAVAQFIENDLGADVRPGRTAIEVWAEGLPPARVSLPAQRTTKYAGVSYRIWSQRLFPILNPTMKINNVCVGSDKLGHFFQQGAAYQLTRASSGGAAAELESELSESGGFGLSTTGVFSNADQEANRQGGRFYQELIATPTMTFTISRYISPRWSEVDNPNFYEESVGRQVWANVLTGAWSGSSWPGMPFGEESLSLDLRANTSGTVAGTFSIGVSPIVGSIRGRITYRTGRVRDRVLGVATSATPISSIRIAFDWTLSSESGKGLLDSSNEQHLTGSWGRGTSGTNRGTLDIRRR